MTDDPDVPMLVLDTSMAVPYLMRAHPQHDHVRAAVAVRRPRLTGHSMVETYSVLTRLPGDARVDPEVAAQVIERSFGPPIVLTEKASSSVVATLAAHGIAGGAVYDGLVALAAVEHQVPLMTRDTRATATYAVLGVAVIMVADPTGGATGS